MRTFLFLFLLVFPKLVFSFEVVLLFGPPGSGKGTFAQCAKEKGYEHISAGDLVRDEVARKTEIGLAIEELVRKGEYINPVVMFQLVQDRALACVAKNHSFIIDGYGRTASDAARLREFLREIKAPGRVFFLDASDATCKERILNRLVCPCCFSIYNRNMGYQIESLCTNCHNAHLEVRLNDTPQVIEKRLKQYREEIEPCYRAFLVELPAISYNTDRDLQSCLAYYNALLDGWAVLQIKICAQNF